MQKDELIRHLNKQTNVTCLYWGHSTYVAGQKFPKLEKKCTGKTIARGVRAQKDVLCTICQAAD